VNSPHEATPNAEFGGSAYPGFSFTAFGLLALACPEDGNRRSFASLGAKLKFDFSNPHNLPELES